jgi:hypothetical protein
MTQAAARGGGRRLFPIETTGPSAGTVYATLVGLEVAQRQGEAQVAVLEC